MKINTRATGLAAVVVACAFGATTASSLAASQASRPEYVEPRVYSAAEAIRDVAEAPSSGLPGQFAFILKGGGRDGDRVFLNSESDYREAGTLTVALDEVAVDALTAQLEGPPERRLIGRTIVVNGVARRTRINLLANGRPTGEYYFQTHIDVGQADHIHVVPGQALPITVTRPRTSP